MIKRFLCFFFGHDSYLANYGDYAVRRCRSCRKAL